MQPNSDFSFLEKIAEQLILESKQNAAGIYWENVTKEKTEVLYDLYSGNSGILFSLITYYSVVPSDKFKNLILSSAKWIQTTYDFSLSPVFLTGELGIAFCFTYLERVLGSYLFKDFKKKLINSSIAKLNLNNSLPAEYINGLSGSITALNAISTSDEEFNVIIKKIFFKIMRQSTLVNKTVIWDFSDEFCDALCGLSHGMSGIGYTLLNLSQLFDSDEIKKLALNTLERESACYNENARGWPDNRKGIHDDNHRDYNIKLFIKREFKLLNTPTYFNAWCHGAVGIGLARLKILERFKDLPATFTNDFEKSVDNTVRDTKYAINASQINPSFCHGILANYHLIYTSAVLTSSKELTDLSAELRGKICEFLLQNNWSFSGLPLGNVKDLSLFNGLSGVLQCFVETDFGIDQEFNVFLPNWKVRKSAKKFPVDLLKIELLKKLMCFSWSKLSGIQKKMLVERMELSDILEQNFDLIATLLGKEACNWNLAVDCELIDFQTRYTKLFESKIQRLWCIEQLKAYPFNQSECFGENVMFHRNELRVLQIDKIIYFLEAEKNWVFMRRCNQGETSILKFLASPKSFKQLVSFVIGNVVQHDPNENSIKLTTNILLSCCFKELIFFTSLSTD